MKATYKNIFQIENDANFEEKENDQKLFLIDLYCVFINHEGSSSNC